MSIVAYTYNNIMNIKPDMSMKPDWEDAPRWARFLAMDLDGHWYWYEDMPVLKNFTWNPNGGNTREAGRCVSMWDKSLEARPE